MKRFEFVEHTADVAARVYGGSLKELFSSAAAALSAVLVKKKKNRASQDIREIVIEKEELLAEDLLKAWLDELLFYFSAKGLVLHRIKSMDCALPRLRARVLVEEFDPQYYESRNEVKAITYHELKVEKIRNKWRAFIVFDV